MIKVSYKIKAILLAVFFTQIVEVLLLQRKYDLFTGGFLQPFSYLTWQDRALFLGISFWVDFAFFGVLGLVWFAAARKLKINCLLAAYNFIFLSCSFMGIWLAVKFKVLEYFNDTLNFLIIRNLGGGSLLEALTYAADEASMIIIVIFVFIVLYWIGLRAVKLSMKNTSDSKSYIGSTNPWLLVSFILITIALIYYSGRSFEMRYGLGRKTSFMLISAALDSLTDLDRDGFGAFSYISDKAPLDPGIYPGALDIPGNGKDENGLGGDFIWHGKTPDSLAQISVQSGDHILLIMLESARADLVHKKWEGRTVAPNINELADTGTAVKYAYTHTGYTASSIKALFNRTISDETDKIPLIDFLESSDYEISFISGQDESFGGTASSIGMDAQGRYLFDARSALDDRVYSSKAPGSLRLSEERIVQQFFERSEELNWDKPQFFYINLQAAHFPYSHPKMPGIINEKPIPRSEISPENRKMVEASYWNAIAVADQAVGDMINHMKNIGMYEKTVVMILGDHGESLFDDGFLGHGHALNKIQTHIPLIINRPGLSIQCAVGQMDMAELLVQAASRQFNPVQWDDKERAVLQIIGDLQKPQLAGIVSYDEVRTILDFRNRRIFFSDLERWEDFDDALQYKNLSKRVKTLVEKWETACWENHISK
ncbi:Sulfatase N-terminal domain-containing protein [Desulfonema limicola]|uniref:Sulfatase N-terminal domain-containing protein n=1 Tax=Desulfonema limicola TaxID=45656 RepID=A0A975B5E3_9BACT|nr:sulfatase-like hydrolase/transferase [Desulfonema limicola]QTA79115.1 Sulfatase N-terminal domain-containing protein [Desulfonema limicola]